MRHLPLAVVLVAQFAVVAAVPARQVAARWTGTPILLETRPVDPYSILAGYYVTLDYEAEWPAKSLVEPGLAPGERVWLTVERAAPAWRAVSVTRDRPAAAPDRVAIRARWRDPNVEIDGAGRFYLPEARRGRVDAERLGNRRTGIVEMRVGRDGTPALLKFTIGDVVIDTG